MTATQPPDILEVDDLHTGYGRLEVVRGLSLHVAPGEVLGLLGPNGHGKSTALSSIAGTHPVRRGTVRFDGADVTRERTTQIVRRGLAYLPQGSPLFPRLSVAENLRLGGRLPRARPHRSATLARVHELFPVLHQRRSQLVGTLSGGERQMVAIGIGLMAMPKLLILDEPTLGLAPKVRHEILDTLLEVKQSGLALVVADGDVDFLFALADRWQFVELGRVVREGSAAERPSDNQVMQMYIGGGHGG